LFRSSAALLLSDQLGQPSILVRWCSNGSKDSLKEDRAFITTRSSFLPHLVYVACVALSSIYIISTTIYMNRNIFPVRKVLYEHFRESATSTPYTATRRLPVRECW